MRATCIRLAVVALALVLMPLPAQAQFGDMLKKAAKDKVKEKVAGGGEAKPAPAAEGGSRDRRAGQPSSGAANASSKSPYNSWVLEITPGILDRFAIAIREENRARDSLIALMNRKPEFEKKHADCVHRISQGEKMQAYMNKLGDDKLSDAAKQKAMMEMNDYMVATCGQQHENEATLAEDALRRGAFTELAAKAGGFDSKGQYGVVRERIMPLCRSSSSEGSVQLPGDGHNVYWVYSESEVSAIRPRCGELAKLIKENA